MFPLRKSTASRLPFFVKLALIFLFTAQIFYGQVSQGVDLTFNAVPTSDPGTNVTGNLAVQPDGKILVFGTVGGTTNYFQRINQDGSVDSSFSCAVCNWVVISSVLIQPNGKILVGGYYEVNNTLSGIVLRLNQDGSQDSNFSAPLPLSAPPSSSSAAVNAVQPDGKIFVTLRSSHPQIGGELSIYRLNTDGSIDGSFTRIRFSHGRTTGVSIPRILPLADGKILIGRNDFGGFSASAYIERYNADGTRDTSFESPTFGNTDFRSEINDFDVSPDGGILVVGRFTRINGIERNGLAKLQAGGNVDLSFAPTHPLGGIDPPKQIKVLSNGQFLVATSSRLIRFNADGTVDNSFNPAPEVTGVGSFAIDAANRILLFGTINGTAGYARLNPNGSLDPTFSYVPRAPGTVTAIALQPDGKIIVGGNFTRINNVTRNRLARLNTDGTTDTSFNPGAGLDNSVFAIAVQPDGKILVGGSFTSYNGVARPGLARLLPDGTLDSGFIANVNQSQTVYSIAIQPDGKILVGGSFTSINGVARNGVARLNSNGTLDAAFNASLGSAEIRSILVQADGKILIGGSFNGVGGFNRSNLTRLNADGSLDASFNAGSIGAIKQIELQSDGKYVILTGNTVARLNNNGAADNTFQAATFNDTVNAITVETGGSIVVGGNFTSVNGIPRLRLARLRADGRVDLPFFPSGVNRQILTLLRQPDGKILAGGEFTSIGNVNRNGIARLISNPAQNNTQFDYDADGRADLTVFRPSNGFWYRINSGNNSFTSLQFGASSDRIAPADYDGDGKTDIAVFRENVPGAGGKAYFYIIQSSNNSFRPEQFGGIGDVPVSGD